MEATCKSHSIEHCLFNDWQKEFKEKYPEHGFVVDGIIDTTLAKWNAAPRKILFLMKDAHNDEHEYNLRYFITHFVDKKNQWYTWANAARWAYGLMNSTQHGYPSFEDADFFGKSGHRAEILSRIAIVEMKKSTGGSSLSRYALNEYFEQYPECLTFTARQIALYGAVDFILCCGDGVFDVFHRMTKLPSKPMNARIMAQRYYVASNRERCPYYFTDNGAIVIDYKHPNLRGNDKRGAYIRLMNIAKDAINNQKK